LIKVNVMNLHFH